MRSFLGGHTKRRADGQGPTIRKKIAAPLRLYKGRNIYYGLPAFGGYGYHMYMLCVCAGGGKQQTCMEVTVGRWADRGRIGCGGILLGWAGWVRLPRK